MKKILFALFVFLRFMSASGQQVYLIPKAGLSVHTFSGTTGFYEKRTNTGFMGGVAFEVGLSKNNRLALQPEILYVRKGGKLDFPEIQSDSPNDEVYRIDYLEIPLLLRLNTGNGKLGIFLNAGPCVGIGMGGRHSYIGNANYRGYDNKISFSKSEDMRATRLAPRLDLGFQAGGGISYAVGRLKFLGEVRYGHGMQAVSSKAAGPEINGLRNRLLMLSAGVALPLGKG